MRPGETAAEWSTRIDAKYDRLASKEAVVYRALDSYGLLLYIGCTVNPTGRMAAHRSMSQWHRYAETIGLDAYPTRAEALVAEASAIATEGSYFNATRADIRRTQANRNAAQRRVYDRGIRLSRIDEARLEDDAYWAARELEQHAYDRAVALERGRLSMTGQFPYLTEAGRLTRYLAARTDAHLATVEVAA